MSGGEPSKTVTIFDDLGRVARINEIDNLNDNHGCQIEPPTTERQARPLAKLPPEQQPEAWQAANDKAHRAVLSNRQPDPLQTPSHTSMLDHACRYAGNRARL